MSCEDLEKDINNNKIPTIEFVHSKALLYI